MGANQLHALNEFMNHSFCSMLVENTFIHVAKVFLLMKAHLLNVICKIHHYPICKWEMNQLTKAIFNFVSESFRKLNDKKRHVLHSKKFEMNGNPNLILSENICNLPIIWNLILNKYPPLFVSQDGKLPAATLKWNIHPQQEYQFWECGFHEESAHL